MEVDESDDIGECCPIFHFESEEFLNGHTAGTTEWVPSLEVRPRGLTTRLTGLTTGQPGFDDPVGWGWRPGLPVGKFRSRGSIPVGGLRWGTSTPVERTTEEGRWESSRGSVEGHAPEGGGSGGFPTEMVKIGYPEEADICRNRIFR